MTTDLKTSNTDNPFLLPDSILSKEEIAAIGKLPTADQTKARKWWSLYDIMKYFHSGLIPISNDVNLFTFQIDLTKESLNTIHKRFPLLETNIKTDVEGNLNPLELKIQTEFLKRHAADIAANQTAQQNLLNAQKTIISGNSSSVSINPETETTNNEFSSLKIEELCFTGIKKIPFNTLHRFIIVTSNMTPAPPADLNQIVTADSEPATATATAAPAPAAGTGGNRQKTRKGRKSYKKKKVSKTHRRYRR